LSKVRSRDQLDEVSKSASAECEMATIVGCASRLLALRTHP